jgi:NAD-dependent dihydropyrimidine dehydrogenase PreA subunit
MCVRTLITVEAQDPLKTVRNLLRVIWTHAGLDGLFITLWYSAGPPHPALIKSLDQIDHADPFAPVMRKNSAIDAVQSMQKHPQGRFGFMLRPCELRCFNTLRQHLKLSHTDGLLISSDCLATFPLQDFEWRLEDSEDREQMTQSILHFAIQGGLQPSRYRNSCQFCDRSYPENADLSIELLGINTSENLILKSRTHAIHETLGLDQFGGQVVPEEITRSRERILMRLSDWRQQALAYATSHLHEDQKTIKGLINHLLNCPVCRQTLHDCCPYFDFNWMTSQRVKSEKQVETWLKACSGCGMCESDCPEGFPLFLVILSLSKALRK